MNEWIQTLILGLVGGAGAALLSGWGYWSAYNDAKRSKKGIRFDWAMFAKEVGPAFVAAFAGSALTGMELSPANVVSLLFGGAGVRGVTKRVL